MSQPVRKSVTHEAESEEQKRSKRKKEHASFTKIIRILEEHDESSKYRLLKMASEFLGCRISYDY